MLHHTCTHEWVDIPEYVVVFPSTAGTFRYATDTPTIRFRVVSGTAPATVTVCPEPAPRTAGQVCTAEISCASVTAVVGSNTDYTCAISTGLTVGNLIYVINAAGETVTAKQGDVVDSTHTSYQLFVLSIVPPSHHHSS